MSSAFVSASGDAAGGDAGAPSKGDVIYSDDDQLSDSDASDAEARKTLSKRKLRRMQRLTVAELKQMVPKPELVEGADVTANDPRLLLQLKATRNAVPVPPHWSQKRAYLQNKRGVEKPPYLLPGECEGGVAWRRLGDAEMRGGAAGSSLRALASFKRPELTRTPLQRTLPPPALRR